MVQYRRQCLSSQAITVYQRPGLKSSRAVYGYALWRAYRVDHVGGGASVGVVDGAGQVAGDPEVQVVQDRAAGRGAARGVRPTHGTQRQPRHTVQ